MNGKELLCMALGIAGVAAIVSASVLTIWLISNL
jgi:hypothetical protein